LSPDLSVAFSLFSLFSICGGGAFTGVECREGGTALEGDGALEVEGGGNFQITSLSGFGSGFVSGLALTGGRMPGGGALHGGGGGGGSSLDESGAGLDKAVSVVASVVSAPASVASTSAAPGPAPGASPFFPFFLSLDTSFVTVASLVSLDTSFPPLTSTVATTGADVSTFSALWAASSLSTACAKRFCNAFPCCKVRQSWSRNFANSAASARYASHKDGPDDVVIDCTTPRP